MLCLLLAGLSFQTESNPLYSHVHFNMHIYTVLKCLLISTYYTASNSILKMSRVWPLNILHRHTNVLMVKKSHHTKVLTMGCFFPSPDPFFTHIGTKCGRLTCPLYPSLVTLFPPTMFLPVAIKSTPWKLFCSWMGQSGNHGWKDCGKKAGLDRKASRTLLYFRLHTNQSLKHLI